jgi:transcriptional regulator with PAS, ATPase and Fis domain
VIAASNTNLEQMVVQGTFRADLYYRFAVITLDIPPLRERPEDILPLARHFINAETSDCKVHPTLSQEAADVLVSYKWPGNVRELENAIKHAVTFLQDGTITPDLLPPRILSRAQEAKVQRATATGAANTNTSSKDSSSSRRRNTLNRFSLPQTATRKKPLKPSRSA